MTASKLTKSKFRMACECPTKIYYLDKPKYANQLMKDSFLKALAEGGFHLIRAILSMLLIVFCIGILRR